MRQFNDTKERLKKQESINYLQERKEQAASLRSFVVKDGKELIKEKTSNKMKQVAVDASKVKKVTLIYMHLIAS